MLDWIIWTISTALVALFALLIGILKDHNEELAGFVALIIGILVMIFIFPMAF